MEKNLDVTKPRYSEHMCQSSLALRYIEVPLRLTIRWLPGVPLGLADGICRINLGLGNCSPTPPLT